MKAAADKFTADLLGNRRGRPNKVDALSGAERQRLYRLRRRNEKSTSISVTRNENSSNQTYEIPVFICHCNIEKNHCSGICKIGQLGHV